MEHFMPGFDFLISQVRKTASFYVTTFALFLYHVVFDEHMKCSCKHGIKPEVTYNQCIYYMVLPALILLLLTLWMDGEFQRVLRITCRCRCNLWRRLVRILIKAVAIGSLWVVSVLIDGDWFVCYKRSELPCRNNTTPFQNELEKQLETHFKRESMVYGLVLVLVLLVVNSILTAIPWRDICCGLYAILRCCCCWCSVMIPCCSLCILKILTKFKEYINCCTTSECANCCKTNCKIKPYHRELFEEIIWEETEILIEKDLKRRAQECVVLKSRELLPSLPNAAPPTQGGDRSTSTTSTTQEGDSPTSTTQEGDSSTSTTSTTQEGDSPTSTTQEGDSPTSTTTHPEVEDRVITLDNLDFDKISDLYSHIISSMFPEPPSSAASTAPANPPTAQTGRRRAKQQQNRLGNNNGNQKRTN